jgi:hypothetical protein
VPENVGWWYTEIACDGGSVGSSSSSSSDGCAPYPLLSTPSDPLNACFATNGKCYRCNPDRGSDCGYGWVWSSGFSEGNVGWWYEEVPCDGGGSNGCPVNSFLPKKSVLEKDSEYAKEDVSYEIWKNKTQIFYDALGRRTQANPKVRRYLFAPRIGKTTTLDIGTLLKKEGETNVCGNLRVDYGIMNGNLHIGGITCPQVVPEATFIPSQDWPLENSEKCSDGSSMLKLDNVQFSVSPKRLAVPKIYVVPVGFKFDDNYVATKSDVDNVYKHELGHQKYIECLNFPTENITLSGCYCIKDLEKMRNDKLEEMKDTYYDMVKRAEKDYHNKYDYFGYPNTYECPH